MLDDAYVAIESLVLELENNKKNENEAVKKMLNKSDFDIDNLTLVQLHILDIIKSNVYVNNTFISTNLNISKPAVTKAVKILINKNLVYVMENSENRKSVYYGLTNIGFDLSKVHENLHREVKKEYYDLLEKFDDKELSIIIKFLNEWKHKI